MVIVDNLQQRMDAERASKAMRVFTCKNIVALIRINECIRFYWIGGMQKPSLTRNLIVFKINDQALRCPNIQTVC